MQERSLAGDGIADLPRPAPGVGDKFRKRLRQDRRVDGKADWRNSEQHDRRQILEGIVGHLNDAEFRNALTSNEGKRRLILEAMLLLLSEDGEDPIVLLYPDAPLVSAKDVPWMIERLKAAASKNIQQEWARLMERVVDWREAGQSEIVLTACQENPILAEAFASLLRPIEIDSPEAQEMKDRAGQLRQCPAAIEQGHLGSLLIPCPILIHPKP